ncbi:Hypothetical protein A7982_09388 [Minicystis rosea]|nr:Hypothetical protein A7982_09388 [Minicystis rosea]
MPGPCPAPGGFTGLVDRCFLGKSACRELLLAGIRLAECPRQRT